MTARPGARARSGVRPAEAPARPGQATPGMATADAAGRGAADPYTADPYAAGAPTGADPAELAGRLRLALVGLKRQMRQDHRPISPRQD
jgi:hypothetical protein